MKTSAEICRICLLEVSNPTKPLLDPLNPNCNEIAKKIEICGGITVKICDELPKNVCEECLKYLEISHKFRTMCQASQTALLNKISIKSEMDFETTDLDLTQPPAIKEEFISNKEQMKKSRDISISDRKLVKEEVHHDNEDAGLLNNDSSASEYHPDDVDFITKSIRNHTTSKYSNRLRLSKIRKRPKSSLTNSKSPKSELISRNRKKKNDPPLKIMCEICGNMYNKQSILNLHMRRHLAEKPYICELCSKAFACQAEMNRHMRVHTGAKPFACKYCGRTFGDRSTNLKHERIHTNERPFSCGTCGKTFTYSNVLKNHILTHTGEKAFRCIPCDKTFSRKHQLAQHLATRTHQLTVNSVSNEDLKQDPDLM